MLEQVEPLPYPLQGALLSDIRRAGRGQVSMFLAGQAAGLVRQLPARELVETLVRETEEVVARLGRGA
jgi:NAD(P)H-dependent flavin oxidoreductase YrpB (nitropropane dioxygenase family)